MLDWLNIFPENEPGLIAFILALIVGAIFAVGFFILQMPAVLVIVASALAGAGAAIAGIVVGLGLVPVAQMDSGIFGVYEAHDLGWFWLIVAIAIAIAGAVYQSRTVADMAAGSATTPIATPASPRRPGLPPPDSWPREGAPTSETTAGATGAGRYHSRHMPEERPTRRIAVARADELPEGTMLMVQVDATDILLVNQDGLHALQGICSHEYFELDKGFLTDDSLTCALHLSRFDLVSGEALDPPAELPLATFRGRARWRSRSSSRCPRAQIPVNM